MQAVGKWAHATNMWLCCMELLSKLVYIMILIVILILIIIIVIIVIM